MSEAKRTAKFPTVLYHFTRRDSVRTIIEMGELRPTDANLKGPDGTDSLRVHPFIPNSFVFCNDGIGFHPVVWLTKDSAGAIKANGLTEEKAEFRFTFPFAEPMISWRKFSSGLGMDWDWRTKFEKNGLAYNWYVHEGALAVAGAKLHRRVGEEWVEVPFEDVLKDESYPKYDWRKFDPQTEEGMKNALAELAKMEKTLRPE